eukprot:SAG11_NODE_24015_length_379_cov_0.907143_1_plen_50_part_10
MPHQPSDPAQPFVPPSWLAQMRTDGEDILNERETGASSRLEEVEAEGVGK